MYKLIAIRDEKQTQVNMEDEAKISHDPEDQDEIVTSLFKLLMSGATSNKEDVLLPLLAVIQNTQDKKKRQQLQRLFDHLLTMYEDEKVCQKYNQYETYDEYYEDIDQVLKENNRHFFDEGLEYEQCQGIMDEDDLQDYDKILLRAF